MKTGIELIAEERARHESLGYNAEHDDAETAMQLSCAAGCYIAAASDKHLSETTHGIEEPLPWTRFQILNSERGWVDGWPWEKKFDKRENLDPLRLLTIAGALIAAEIDRLQRSENL